MGASNIRRFRNNQYWLNRALDIATGYELPGSTANLPQISSCAEAATGLNVVDRIQRNRKPGTVYLSEHCRRFTPTKMQFRIRIPDWRKGATSNTCKEK